MMDKPLTIRRYELIDKLCNAINEAQMPAFVTVDILERMLIEVRKIADIEYENDLKSYESREVTHNEDN